MADASFHAETRRRRGAQMVQRGLALALTALFLLPLYWALVASLGRPGQPPASTVAWWPREFHWQNYVEIFRIVPMGRYLGNSLLVVGLAAPLTLLIAAPAGFALAQLPRTARRILFRANVILLMIPGMAVWIFRYQLLHWLGLYDSLWALVLPAFAASNPLFVLLFYWAFRHIPDELYESARLDGADAFTILRAIAWPLAQPTVAGVLVLAVAMYWSDFTGPVLYIYRPALYTLPVGLKLLQQLPETDWPLLMAGAVFMTLPVAALFMALQRRFLHELSIGRLLDKG